MPTNWYVVAFNLERDKLARAAILRTRPIPREQVYVREGSQHGGSFAGIVRDPSGRGSKAQSLED